MVKIDYKNIFLSSACTYPYYSAGGGTIIKRGTFIRAYHTQIQEILQKALRTYKRISIRYENLHKQ